MLSLMTLTLPAETERLIDELVRSGRFPTREAVVTAAVDALFKRLSSPPSSPDP